MSARACSRANSVFFEAQPLAPQELPDRIVGDRDPARGQLVLQPVQRQVRVLVDPLDDEGSVRLQNAFAMAAHLSRRYRAGRTITLRPFTTEETATPKDSYAAEVESCILPTAQPGSFDQARAVASSRVQRNSVPSLHIRCMMTGHPSGQGTTALRRLPRLPMFVAQAFSQDHLLHTGEHHPCRLIEQRSHHPIPAQGNAADALALSRFLEHPRQSQSSSDSLRVAEAGRDIGGTGQRQGNDRPTPGTVIRRRQLLSIPDNLGHFSDKAGGQLLPQFLPGGEQECMPSASFRTRTSTPNLTGEPTLRPKLRSMPRMSFSIAMAFSCSSFRAVSRHRRCWLA